MRSRLAPWEVGVVGVFLVVGCGYRGCQAMAPLARLPPAKTGRR